MSSNKLDKNPFKEGSNAWEFLELANVDYNTGYSDVVPIDILEEKGLGFGNGGSWARSDGPLGKYFNIHRKIDKKIISVQLVGYKKNFFSQNINPEITKHYKSLPCRVLAVNSSVEVDHKDGRKDKYDLHDNQGMSDFQPLHQNANKAKRQHCKDCKKTNVRFDARRLGYSIPQWIGPEKYVGDCLGCYWHDPAEFNGKVSANYIKNN